jgi:hypothetical protein
MRWSTQVGDQSCDITSRKLSCPDSVANDRSVTSEMSNELKLGAPGASVTFRAVHNLAINNSTLNDVQGNYVRDHFVACVDHI